MEKRINWKVLIVCFAAVHLAALVGSLVTNADTEGYESVKPGITPPNYVFPIVWSILFILISLSLYFAWISAKSRKNKKRIIFIFGINLALNVLWSYLFFGMQKPAAAFADLIFLWISIIIMLAAVYRISKISFWMLLPYLIWVSFAGILNWLIAF